MLPGVVLCAEESSPLLSFAMSVRAAHQDEVAAIRNLLRSSGLPTEDIVKADIRWFVSESRDYVTGVVGVEVFGNAGLLRSLTVTPDMRGSGTGAELVRYLEQWCREQGMRELVLLTQTAAQFFARRGYSHVERKAVPAAVQTSAEFRTLCPASATCMEKRLTPLKRVLFVCVENSNRSQMAEAFAHIHAGASIYATSAGSRPSGRVNPRAVQFMAELGYDLTRHRSKSLDQISGEFDAVVTMGCGDSCPWVPTKHRYDWNLPDPKDLPDDDYRLVRDDIGKRVRDLLESM